MIRKPHLWLVPALVLTSCTGRLPGTAAPMGPEHRLGVQQPVPAEPQWMEPQEPPAEAPPEPVAAAPEPVPEYRATLPSSDYGSAPAPAYEAPMPQSAPAYGAPAPQSAPPRPFPSSSSTQRDQQIAILTDAVTALREEIARSYTHSQELVEETRKLRAQVKSLRTELEGSKRENQRLRNQVRALEKQIGEIRLVPVPTEPTPPPAEIPPADDNAPAAPAP